MLTNAIFWIKLVPTILLICIGIPGNLSILYYFLIKCWKKINSYHLFIIYLALTDLMICVLRSFNILPTLIDPESKLTAFICEDLWLLPAAFSTTSILILCGLSYDRYRKITKPFAKKIPKWIVHLIFGISVSIGFLLFGPYVGKGEILFKSIKVCRVMKRNADGTLIAAYVIHFLFSCLVPIPLITFLNIRIFISLKKQRKTNSTIQQQETFQRHLKASKTIKCLTIISAMFVFIPNIFLATVYTLFVASLTSNFRISFPNELLATMDNLIFINTIVNVFVYWAHVKEFRHFYRKKFYGLRSTKYEMNLKDNESFSSSFRMSASD